MFDEESSIHIEMLRDVHDRVFRDLVIAIDYDCIRGEGMKANRAHEAYGVITGFLQEFRQSGQEIARLKRYHVFGQIHVAVNIARSLTYEVTRESNNKNKPNGLEGCGRRGLDLDSRRIG